MGAGGTVNSAGLAKVRLEQAAGAKPTTPKSPRQGGDFDAFPPEVESLGALRDLIER